MLLGLTLTAEATVRRRTPFNPFRGPVPVAPRNLPSHGFDSRGFARGFGDVLVTRTFVDRFGRVRVGLFDINGNLVRIIR